MNRSASIRHIISISIGLIIAAVWYFVLKDYNYKISFTSPQAPGIIYSSLLEWNNGENPANKAVTTLSKAPFSEIRQEVKAGDSVFTYHWIIHRKNDSVTRVTAHITDKQHSFLQKLQVPFYKNAFVRSSIATVNRVENGLKRHHTTYKVAPVTKGKFPSTYCAYISLKSALRDKAGTMIRNIGTIMGYLRENNIPLTGNPFLEVTAWDMEEDQITFDFCFPVEEKDTYPPNPVVKFKRAEEKIALKTTFNGNYRISDRAWYTLIDHAEIQNIPIKKLPVEIFLNDPHMGGDALQWQAEVYMPVEE